MHIRWKLREIDIFEVTEAERYKGWNCTDFYPRLLKHRTRGVCQTMMQTSVHESAESYGTAAVATGQPFRAASVERAFRTLYSWCLRKILKEWPNMPRDRQLRRKSVQRLAIVSACTFTTIEIFASGWRRVLRIRYTIETPSRNPFPLLSGPPSIHSRDFEKYGGSRDRCTRKLLIVDARCELQPLYATRADRCGLPIALCRTANLLENPFYVTFRPSKGNRPQTLRDTSVRRARAIQFSQFMGGRAGNIFIYYQVLVYFQYSADFRYTKKNSFPFRT